MAKGQAPVAAEAPAELPAHVTVLPDGTIVEDNTLNPNAVSPARVNKPQGPREALSAKVRTVLPDGTIVEDF